MGLKCQISHREGHPIVYDSNGEVSQLYMDALDVTGNEEEALNLWATSQLDSFKKLSNFGDNPSIDDVIKFYDTLQADGNSLGVSETFQIKRFMQTNGFSSLSEAYSNLQKIFKPQGILTLDTGSALKSGLYSSEELSTIDLETVGNILSKIEGQLGKEDIFVEPQSVDFFYKNSEYKTLLGTYEKVSSESLDEDLNKLIDNFSNEQELYSRIQDLPYVDFVEKFFTDEIFAQQTINRLKGLRKIPVLTYVAGQLTDQNMSYYTTLKNTFLSGVDPLPFEANFDYLSHIDFSVWNKNLSEISQILKEIEEQAIESNIDVIGLHTKAADIPGVMTILQKLVNLINSNTEPNLVSFSNSYTALFGNPVESASVEKLADQYEGLNIVKVFSNLNNDQLFSQDGLIPIGENYFHKVQIPVNKSEMYEYLYKSLTKNNWELPIEFARNINIQNPLEKVSVLNAISEYVMSRDVGFPTSMQEDISLNQLVFSHLPLIPSNTREDITMLLGISTDETYLRGPFISDFYKYILSEKMDDSEVYRDTLSKFQINDRDISLLSPVESIDDIQYSQELKDYIRLKKDNNMKYLVTNISLPVLEDLLFLNRPDLIPNSDRKYLIDGDYILTKSLRPEYMRFDDIFIKYQGNSYRKIMNLDGISSYLKIKVQLDNVYYTVNTDFSHYLESAIEVIKKNRNIIASDDSFEDFRNTIARSQVENSWFYNRKIDHKLSEEDIEYFSNKFGDFSVIVGDKDTFYKKLEESDNLNSIELSEVLSARFQYKYGLSVIGNWSDKLNAVKTLEECCDIVDIRFIQNNSRIVGFRSEDASEVEFPFIQHTPFGYIDISDLLASYVDKHGQTGKRIFIESVIHEFGHAVSSNMGERAEYWRANDGTVAIRKKVEGDYLEFAKIAGWNEMSANNMATGDDAIKIPRDVNTPLITDYAETSLEEAFAEYFSAYITNKNTVEEIIKNGITTVPIQYKQEERKVSKLDLQLFRKIKELVFDRIDKFKQGTDEKILNVSSVVNSKIELLSLYSPEQGEDIINQIDECG